MPIDNTNRVLNWRPDRPDFRDFKYEVQRYGVEQQYTLPVNVDLSKIKWYPKCYDQGDIGSCTANCIGGAIHFNQGKQNLPQYIPSRLFIYYNERAMEGTISNDAGAVIRSGIKSVNKHGYAKEDLWPYDESKFKKKPPVIAYKDAAKHKATAYYRLNNKNITYLKTCLAAGYPFVFGFTMYKNFWDADKNGGIIPMPSGEEIGGHAVACVGYDDTKGMFLIRNSWGTASGDGTGHYTMPYAYMSSTDLCDDFWTIRSVT